MPESTGAPQPSPSRVTTARVRSGWRCWQSVAAQVARGQVGGGQQPVSVLPGQGQARGGLGGREAVGPGVLGPGGVVQPGQGPAGRTGAGGIDAGEDRLVVLGPLVAVHEGQVIPGRRLADAGRVPVRVQPLGETWDPPKVLPSVNSGVWAQTGTQAAEETTRSRSRIGERVMPTS